MSLRSERQPKDVYVEASLPEDYLQWKRVDVLGCNDCCSDRRMTVYLAEEANVNQLLRDEHKKPSFEWAETFATLKGNKVNIYTNGDFNINEASLVYYRQPVRIEILDCVNPYTGQSSNQEVESEFKDDIIEVIIDEAVSILAGDMESGNQFGRGTQTAERNN